jgi:hypothetical protein
MGTFFKTELGEPRILVVSSFSAVLKTLCRTLPDLKNMQISRESAAFANVPVKLWRVAPGFANVAAGYFRQTCDILFKPTG